MPVCHDTFPEDVETTFVTILNVLAKKYGCKVIDCDYEKKYIELDCPDESKQLRLSLELDKLLHLWDV